jgi:general secretion pathway protein B
MSYILDALRRADAERERGSVPGLHSQTVPPTTAEAAPRRALGPWAGAGIGGAVVLLGAAGWFLLRPGAGPAAPAVPAAALSAAPVAPAVTLAPPVATPREPAPTTAPAPMPPPAPVRVAPPVAAAAPAKAPAASRSPPAAPTASLSPPEPAASLAPPPAPAPPPRAEPRVVNFEQLPEDVRRAIPPLAIGGAIYSDNPASRMLIVGGQLLHEGDSAGPGVTLEQIRPRSAVLRWKDLRYELNF